jgi:hypothetical protein
MVGSKSPIARSWILRSPSAVRIFVPLRKQLWVEGDEGLEGLEGDEGFEGLEGDAAAE